MTFKQHIPPMVTTNEPPFTFEFDTAEWLLSHHWIAEWREHPGFYRFSVTNYIAPNGEPDGALLMAEFRNHPRWRWWVLGHLTGGDAFALGLPVFDAAAAYADQAARIRRGVM